MNRWGEWRHKTRRVDKYGIPSLIRYGVLQEIATLDRGRECRTLSRNIHLAAQSLNDIWRYELQLPRFEDTREQPTLADQIVIFGGWGRWGNLTAEDKGVQRDALWRPTPRRVWEAWLAELFGRFPEQVPGAPVAVAVPTRIYSTGRR